MKNLDMKKLIIIIGSVAGVLVLAVFLKLCVFDIASENSRLKADLAERNESLAAIRSELSGKSDATAELSIEIEKLKNSIKELEEANKQLSDGKQTADSSAEKELRELRQKLTELENSANASEEKLKEITEKLDSIVSAKAVAYTYLLSTYSTNFTYADQGRVTNLTVASRSLSGSIIMPGETFSFFDVVGECTVPKGYMESKIFLQGEIAEGIGGGICQVSSTLYNAALLAGMKITERHPHSMKVSYVQPGRDATVSYGYLDLKFVNPYNYPVKIIAEVSSGKVTFSFYCEHKKIKVPDVKINVVTESDGSYTMTRTIDGRIDYSNSSKYNK